MNIIYIFEKVSFRRLYACVLKYIPKNYMYALLIFVCSIFECSAKPIEVITYFFFFLFTHMLQCSVELKLFINFRF